MLGPPAEQPTQMPFNRHLPDTVSSPKLQRLLLAHWPWQFESDRLTVRGATPYVGDTVPMALLYDPGPTRMNPELWLSSFGVLRRAPVRAITAGVHFGVPITRFC